MKLRVLWIGKTRDSSLARLISEYESRINHFLPLEIVEVRDPRLNESRRQEAEGEKLLNAIDSSDRVILLDSRGKTWTSDQFANFVARHMRDDPRRLTFVIGGFSGVSESVKKRADLTWSLSPLTFTHDLCRVLILEQIYRALAIIHKHPYAK